MIVLLEYIDFSVAHNDFNMEGLLAMLEQFYILCWLYLRLMFLCTYYSGTWILI